MRYKRLLFVLIGVLICSNIFLLYQLNLSQKEEKNFHQLANKGYYRFNSLASGFNTNCSFEKHIGFFSQINDTILIAPYLKINFNNEDNLDKIPRMYLYTYSEFDSTFKAIDTSYYISNHYLQYVNNSFNTKDLFIRIELPVYDTIERFYLEFPLRTKTIDGVLSVLPKNYNSDSLFHQFMTFE